MVNCPICLKDCHDLGQLNDHLDTDHGFDESRVESNRENREEKKGTDDKDHSSGKKSIQRTHFEKLTTKAACHACQKRFTTSSGCINCRKCGKLYCKRHCTNMIKLNRDAQWDPKGKWYKCCYNCFSSRPGFNNFGLIRDKTDAFMRIRNVKFQDNQLIKLQLENRLMRLLNGIIKLLNDSWQIDNYTTLLGKIKFPISLSQLEKEIVPWVKDTDHDECRICQLPFSITLRRHHCRLCGGIICNNDSGMYSILKLLQDGKDLPFTTLKVGTDVVEKIGVNLRICDKCYNVVFQPRHFTKDIKEPDLILVKYNDMKKMIQSINYLLPKFENLLSKEQQERGDNKAPYMKQLKDLIQIRDKLMKNYNIYIILFRQLSQIVSKSVTQQRIQQGIQIESTKYINTMNTKLKSLTILLPGKANSTDKGDKTEVTDVAEVKQLRNDIMVINEQIYLLNDTMEQFKRQHKISEVQTLQANLEELQTRRDEIKQRLGDESL